MTAPERADGLAKLAVGLGAVAAADLWLVAAWGSLDPYAFQCSDLYRAWMSNLNWVVLLGGPMMGLFFGVAGLLRGLAPRRLFAVAALLPVVTVASFFLGAGKPTGLFGAFTDVGCSDASDPHGRRLHLMGGGDVPMVDRPPAASRPGK